MKALRPPLCSTAARRMAEAMRRDKSNQSHSHQLHTTDEAHEHRCTEGAAVSARAQRIGSTRLPSLDRMHPRDPCDSVAVRWCSGGACTAAAVTRVPSIRRVTRLDIAEPSGLRIAKASIGGECEASDISEHERTRAVKLDGEAAAAARSAAAAAACRS